MTGFLLSYNRQFNFDIGKWNTSSVVSMANMFMLAGKFNQNINAWDVSNVENFSYMFFSCRSFNQPLDNWNVEKGVTFDFMFCETNFNEKIGTWNTRSAETMAKMFQSNHFFNQNISSWNTSKVKSMNDMFSDAHSFNQDIGKWNTSSATNMTGMFRNAREFNQYLGDWDVSNVNAMGHMFNGATNFNQDIGKWNTGKVMFMNHMFGQSAFNHAIGEWDLSSVVTNVDVFVGVVLDCDNYSATLRGWSANPKTPNNIRLRAIGNSYGLSAINARNILINDKNWIIEGDSSSPNRCHESYSKEHLVIYYPNPVKNMLVIEIEEEDLHGYEYVVTSIIGEILYKGIIENKNTKIDLGTITTGIYLVKINFETPMVFKIIKE